MSKLAILLSLTMLVGLACSKPKVEPAKAIAEAPVVHKTADEEADDPIPYGKIDDRQMQTPDWVSTVAISDPTINILNGDRYKVDLSNMVVEKIQAALIKTGRFQVAERTRLNSVKQEIQINNDVDWFNPSTATKVGKFAGAKFLVLPSVSANVGTFSTTFELQVKILETETGTMVHNFTVRTVSSSVDTNASIRTCITSLPDKLEEAMSYDFPARGVVVKVFKAKKGDILWVDTRQAAFIRPGMKMRVLSVDEVYNPIAKTKGNFFAQVGEGIVMNVESAGVTVRVKNKVTPIEAGMVAEVKP